jgi:UDP-2,3-diacylglucosamine hydrolase
VSLAVVLSDVHIGDNSNTCWYQQKYHEGYLKAALNWVATNKQVTNLVLLGDLVDFWTYTPDRTPPTLAQIIKVNPNILGPPPNGALAAAAKAVAANNGKVWLTPGNHDITLTANDANALAAVIGTPIQFVQGDGIQLQGPNSLKTTWFVHGHYFTMFNAPDWTTSLKPMPVGHFVTRIIAWYMNQTMPSGKNVSDYHLWGQPDPGWKQIVDAVLSGQGNIASVLIQAFENRTQIPDSTNVVVPQAGGGTTSMTVGQAKTNYQNLLPNWLQNWPLQDVVRAAMADYTGDCYLAWFAQWLALKNVASLVVAGHTHQPIGGLQCSPVQYVNNGYECCALPDLSSDAAAFTFTVVDLDEAAAQMYKVAPDGHGGYAVNPFSAPTIGVVQSKLYDLSCYVRFTNQVGQEITLDPALTTPAHGRWVVPPPATLANQTVAWAWLQDNPGLHGSQGYFVYNDDFRYDISCSAGAFDNAAGGPGMDFVARSGADGASWNAWQPKGQAPKKGYPLEVAFTLGRADITPGFTGTCGQNSDATSVLGLQPGRGSLELNGSTALQNCIQGNGGACVYSITLEEGSYVGGIYSYRLFIDGQGPSGAGTLFLAFTDQTGDVYHTYFYLSKRQTITKDYNSDAPAIIKVQWSNTYV